mgnify:CR=1 FL=1
MAKLKETSETKIAMSFLVMNLVTLLLRVKRGLLWLFLTKQIILPLINKNKLWFKQKGIKLLYNTKYYCTCVKQAC